jgi:hypothetical protein
MTINDDTGVGEAKLFAARLDAALDEQTLESLRPALKSVIQGYVGMAEEKVKRVQGEPLGSLLGPNELAMLRQEAMRSALDHLIQKIVFLKLPSGIKLLNEELVAAGSPVTLTVSYD